MGAAGMVIEGNIDLTGGAPQMQHGNVYPQLLSINAISAIIKYIFWSIKLVSQPTGALVYFW